MEKDLKFRNCDGSKEDFALLQTIHRTTMESPIIQTMGEWDERFQTAKLMSRYYESNKTLKFLMDGDREIGTMNCWMRNFDDGEFAFIEQFYILPEFQGTGLGSRVLNAHLKDVPTRLSVLNGDVNRMDFYRRRGFSAYREEDVRTYFEWLPKLVIELSKKDERESSVKIRM